MKTTFTTVVHKYIRSEMFGVSLALSGCDVREDASVSAVIARLDRVADLLRTHGEREDAGFLPIIRDRDPDAGARMERDHHRLEEQLDHVCRAVNALPATGHDGRDGALLLAYLDWNIFMAAYFEHLDDEERTLFPLLGDAMPGVAAMAGAAAPIPPAFRAEFLEGLWKALTPSERAVIEAALSAA